MRPPAIRAFLELLRPGTEPTQIELTAADATQLVDLARQQLVASWYWHRLRRGGLSTQLPASQQNELRNLGIAAATQGLRVETGALDVVRLLSGTGATSVLLKGVAYAALAARFPFFEYRQTGDVDLLVDPERADDVWRLLQANGFGRASEAPSLHHDHHHMPTLVGPSGFQIEIHTAASLFLTANDSWNVFGVPAQLVSWRGTNVRIPTATVLLWHSVAHSLGDGPGGCNLRHLLTSASLMRQPIDWEQLQLLLAEHRLFHHDSRRAIPLKGVKRWLSAAAWLAHVELPSNLRASDDSERTLHNLLLAQWRCIAEMRAHPARVARLLRFADEAAIAAFGLGVQDGGHWQTWRQRRKHFISSAILQAAYHVSMPLLQRRA